MTGETQVPQVDAGNWVNGRRRERGLFGRNGLSWRRPVQPRMSGYGAADIRAPARGLAPDGLTRTGRW